MNATDESVATSQYLTFAVAGEAYAIDVLSVREIIEYEHLTRVPNTPDHVRGVMNVRGTVVPVVDLAARFGASRIEPSRLTCVVIVEVDQDGIRVPIGAMVDSVSEVVEFASSEIQPPPSLAGVSEDNHLIGLGAHGDGFVMILDVERALGDAPLRALREAWTPEDLASDPPLAPPD